MLSRQNTLIFVGAVALPLLFAGASNAGIIVTATDVSGLAGEAEFTLINPTTLEIRLRNSSTGVPGGFSNSDQLLTSCAFNLPGAMSILSGTAFTGATSASVNFDVTNVGANTSVGGEWGYGNGGGTGFGTNVNYVSGNTSGTTAFGGPNLDGPAGLDGPQGGLYSVAAPVALGGLGAIQDELILTLTLSSSLANLDFLGEGVIFEYGSDAAFLVTPTPGALSLLVIGALVGGRRRRQ